MVSASAVVGTIPAVADFRLSGCHEGFSLLDWRDRVFGHWLHGLGFIAVNLLGVENRGGTGHQALFGFGVACFRVFGVKLQFFVEDHHGALLALAHLAATVPPLSVGAPEAAAETSAFCRDPEIKDIYAAIALVRVDVEGAIQSLP